MGFPQTLDSPSDSVTADSDDGLKQSQVPGVSRKALHVATVGDIFRFLPAAWSVPVGSYNVLHASIWMNAWSVHVCVLRECEKLSLQSCDPEPSTAMAWFFLSCLWTVWTLCDSCGLFGPQFPINVVAEQ